MAPTILMVLCGRAALVMAVAVLASSTISDPLSRLAREGMTESQRAAQQALDFSSLHQQERLALLRRIAADADSVRKLSLRELQLLFGEPNLTREEDRAVSYHFTSGECALDVYFPREGKTLRRHPVYAEYRVRNDAGNAASPATPDHRNCVKSLFSRVQAPAAHGTAQITNADSESRS